MNYLFWNTNGKLINDILISTIENYNCDIIALAEYNDNISHLIGDLLAKGIGVYPVPNTGCSRITILSTIPPGSIKPLRDTDYYSIKLFPHRTLGSQIICFLHLESQLHSKEYDYLVDISDIKNDIEEVEESNNIDKTIIVGDFNMNPFEQPMISAIGFHAIACSNKAKKLTREIKKKTYKFFYNPMWNLFGDFSKPAGTFYYSKSINTCYFWNIFDQVIIRPSLIDHLKQDKIQIIKDINNVSLLSKQGNPNISDHLPIYFEID